MGSPLTILVASFPHAVNIAPLMTIRGTIADFAECKFHHGADLFKFKGPGWYFNKDGSAVLVYPEGPQECHCLSNNWPTTTVFILAYWPEDPTETFKRLAEAPIRVDGEIDPEILDARNNHGQRDLEDYNDDAHHMEPSRAEIAREESNGC